MIPDPTTILASLGALIAAIFAALVLGRRQGRKAESDNRERADHERAESKRNAADRARAADDAGHVGSSVDRLRERPGRLRD